MKIYKITTKNGQQIPLEESDYRPFIEAVNSGRFRMIETRHGSVDASSIDSVVLHKEMMAEVSERMKYGKTFDQAIVSILGAGIFDDIKKLA